MTKTYTVTDEQIDALRAEAGQAGDVAQVAICDSALDGDDTARAECARVIADAEAMQDRGTDTYAIINSKGEIVSLHDEPVPAGQGWGHDHELVELAQPHTVGDRIDWDARGREIVTK